MEIFGHRGAAGLVAENTIASIHRALAHSVAGIEIDVHRCKSGEIVVLHDDTLDRTTNATGHVADYTLQELNTFHTPEGYGIPTLFEVLTVIDAQCKLNIELKGAATALPTVSLLDSYIATSRWTADDFIISSFDHAQLALLQRSTTRYRIGVLTEAAPLACIDTARALDAYSVHPSIEQLSAQDVTTLQSQGYKVYVWTVNDPVLMQQSKQWNVDGIITDFPNFAP